jgi:hypothetical protein
MNCMSFYPKSGEFILVGVKLVAWLFRHMSENPEA